MFKDVMKLLNAVDIVYKHNKTVTKRTSSSVKSLANIQGFNCWRPQLESIFSVISSDIKKHNETAIQTPPLLISKACADLQLHVLGYFKQLHTFHLWLEP